MNFYDLNILVTESFAKKNIEKANNSYDDWIQTAVSSRVKNIIKHSKNPLKVLDYGSGTDAIHTQYFKNRFLNKNSDQYNPNHKFYAHDFGKNFNDRLHDKKYKKRKYDLIFASNVLNVQSDQEMLEKTLREVKSLMKKDSIFIANYPKSQRYLNLSDHEFIKIIKKYFSDVKIDDKYKQGVLFSCKI